MLLGVCFGEIALLGSGNMNRRTANVRAHGFTTLYVLFKEDLTDSLKDYPEDKALLARKAQKAAKEVAAKQAATTTVTSKINQNVLIPVTTQPEIMSVLLKLVPKHSKISRMLLQGTTENDTFDDAETNEDILVVETTEV